MGGGATSVMWWVWDITGWGKDDVYLKVWINDTINVKMSFLKLAFLFELGHFFILRNLFF